jgi:hypothetical protein
MLPKEEMAKGRPDLPRPSARRDVSRTDSEVHAETRSGGKQTQSRDEGGDLARSLISLPAPRCIQTTKR